MVFPGTVVQLLLAITNAYAFISPKPKRELNQNPAAFLNHPGFSLQIYAIIKARLSGKNLVRVYLKRRERGGVGVKNGRNIALSQFSLQFLLLIRVFEGTRALQHSRYCGEICDDVTMAAPYFP